MKPRGQQNLSGANFSLSLSLFPSLAHIDTSDVIYLCKQIHQISYSRSQSRDRGLCHSIAGLLRLMSIASILAREPCQAPEVAKENTKSGHSSQPDEHRAHFRLLAAKGRCMSICNGLTRSKHSASRSELLT